MTDPKRAEDSQQTQEPVASPPEHLQPTMRGHSLAVRPELRRFGDYELIDELGHGGMGIVFRARQISLDRIVALKMIRSGELADEREVHRFHTEAEAAAHLDHPNVVPVYGVGQHRGMHFFTMKLIEGTSLAREVHRIAKNPRAAATLMASVARAVHHGHQRGILHRDLKPGNILLDKNDQPYVTDFGLAKRSQGDPSITESGAVLGTPAYMSPEQASGRSRLVTVASDVYALGAVLYELLTGRPPIIAETPLEALRQVCETGPAPLSTVNRKVDRDLATICTKCLSREPQHRYHSAAEVADDLERWLAGKPISARPVGTMAHVWRWCRRNRVVASLLGALLVMGVLALVGLTIGTVMVSNAYRAEAKQRTAAEEQKKATEDRERLARWNLYSAQMSMVELERERGRMGPALAILQELRPAPGEDDLRGFEWFYQFARCQESLQTALASDRDYRHVKFSPDGKTLAAAEYNGAITLWELATGKTRQLRPRNLITTSEGSGHAGIAFAPSSREIAAAGAGGRILFWDVADGKVRDELVSHGGKAIAICYSPDGKRLAYQTADQKVSVVELSQKRLLYTLSGRATGWSATDGIAFSPDGKLLVVNGSPMRVLDASTGLVAHHSVHWGSRPAFAPDGATFAMLGNRLNARVIDVKSGESLLDLDMPSMAHAVTFTGDGRQVAIGCMDGTIVLINSAGAAGRRFAHGDRVNGLAGSPDGRLLVSVGGKWVRFWDVSQRQPQAEATLDINWVVDAVFSPNGEFVASTSFNHLQVWDVKTRQLRKLLRNVKPTGPPVFSPDSRQLVCVADGIRIYNLPELELARVIPRESTTIQSIALAPDGRTLLTSDDDRKLRRRDLISGRVDKEVDASSHWSDKGSFSPDGRLIAFADARARAVELRLFDMEVGQLRHVLRGAATNETFSPDQKYIAAHHTDSSTMGRLVVWEVESGREVWRFERKGMRLAGKVAFTADGQTLAAVETGGTIMLWDARNGRLRATLSDPVHSALCIAASPQSPILATGSRSDGNVRFWKAPAEQEVLAGTHWREEIEALALVSARMTQPSTRKSAVASSSLWVGPTAASVRDFNANQKSGFSYERLGDEAKAIEAYRQTLKQDPNDNASKLRLCRLLLGSGENAKANAAEVVRLASEVTRAIPDHETWLGTLAIAQYKAGDYEAAKETAAQQIKLYPDTRDGKYVLGLCWAKQENRGEALWRYYHTHDLITRFGPGDKLHVQLRDELAELLKLPTRFLKEIQTLETGHSQLRAIAFAPDDAVIATAGGDRQVRLWDRSTGKVIAALEPSAATSKPPPPATQSAASVSLAFVPGTPMLLAALGDGTIQLWDVSQRLETGRVQGEAGGLKSIIIDPAGKFLIAAGQDLKVRAWTLPSLTSMAISDAALPPASLLALSPDGGTLAMAHDQREIALWDLRKKQLKGNVSLATPVSMLFTGDGSQLACMTRDGKLHLADAVTWKALSPWLTGAYGAICLAGAPDGQFLAFGTQSGALRLWHHRSHRCLDNVAVPGGAVAVVAFSPDGKHLASGSSDGTLRLWEITRPPGEVPGSK